jgi:hypothetical protein
MSQLIFPKYVLDDVRKFISENYHESLPHSLLIAQTFCLRFSEYGKGFGMSTIMEVIEYMRTHQP